MGTIWFRMRSELKWREVEVASTFITVGELRGLICTKLELDQTVDTVNLISETDADPFPDSKQLPRGSRVRAIRTTLENVERLQTEQAEAKKLQEEQKKEVREVGAEQSNEDGVPHESEDEFGPSVFDVEAQKRYEQREADKKAAAAAEAARQAQQAEEASDSDDEPAADPGQPPLQRVDPLRCQA